MIFTQKRARVVCSKEERDTIYDKVMASVEFTDEEKKRYQECRDFCEEYRKRKAIKKLLNSQKEGTWTKSYTGGYASFGGKGTLA